jgi:hypothetical protein
LQALAGAHPIMEPLLEYRRLEASEPRFASAALYQEVKAGTRAPSVTRLRARLRQASLEGDGGAAEDEAAR